MPGICRFVLQNTEKLFFLSAACVYYNMVRTKIKEKARKSRCFIAPVDIFSKKEVTFPSFSLFRSKETLFLPTRHTYASSYRKSRKAVKAAAPCFPEIIRDSFQKILQHIGKNLAIGLPGYLNNQRKDLSRFVRNAAFLPPVCPNFA